MLDQAALQPNASPISAVIFDWDFTLVQSRGRGIIRWADDAIGALRGARFEQSHVAAVGAAPDQTLAASLAKTYYSLANIQLMDGAKALIDDLRAHQTPVIILSNAPQGAVQHYAKELLGDERASALHIYGAKGQNSPRKPAKDAFLAPLHELSITPDQHVLVIGDRLHYDFKPARELGLTPVLFNPTARTLSRAESYALQHDIRLTHMPSFAELSDYIQDKLNPPIAAAARGHGR